MPVARIFTDSASDSAALAAHLHALGYTVEIASPNSEITVPADLELRMERCSRQQAVDLASERAAGTGANVYVSEGVLQCPAAAAPTVPRTGAQVLAEQVPSPAAEARNPLSPGIAADLQATQPELADEPAPFRLVEPEPDLQSSAAPLPYDGELAAPGSVFASPADPQVPAKAFTLFGTEIRDDERAEQEAVESRLDSEGQHRRVLAETFSSAAAVMRQSWQQARSATVGSARMATQQMRQWHNGFLSALQRPRTADVARLNGVPTTKETEAPQAGVMRQSPAGLIARLEQRLMPLRAELAGRAAKRQPARQRVVVPARASVAARAAIAGPSGQATKRETRPLPWAAFAAAGALAVAALLGWSVLAGRPASPTVPVNSGIQQQVPFGPVKIVPHALPGSLATKIATPTPVSTPIPAPKAPQQTAAAAAKPAPSSTKPQQPRTQQRIARTARHSRPADIADDEVVVHHYNVPPKPTAKTQTASTGVRHISDQE